MITTNPRKGSERSGSKVPRDRPAREFNSPGSYSPTLPPGIPTMRPINKRETGELFKSLEAVGTETEYARRIRTELAARGF
ncbi:hypothetical protein M1M38_gp109 [Halorubrum tailed virus 27]|uniref:Uncharacterized protein n=1 Tax=Halorubrum tailed virus 27 TaxID=2878008 RepID=A0AAE8XY28_9CAUD|nr:hypothetical protein M1M38_gp109 [Halorubrum tailed virus 27]UBF22802.1 hypothetical protein HRTV-27_gp109 [Halorubrum tailed virus 27]